MFFQLLSRAVTQAVPQSLPMRAAAAAVAMVALFGGCGSGLQAKNTVAIHAQLRELEQKIGPHRGSWVVNVSPPNGVSESEWWAAVAADRRLPVPIRRAAAAESKVEQAFETMRSRIRALGPHGSSTHRA